MTKLHCSRAEIHTPLGKMIAIADRHAVVWLSFKSSDRFLEKHRVTVTDEASPVLHQLNSELTRYFKHELTHFSTPINPLGTPFQQTVWQALQRIPHGETWSYAALAAHIERPTAYRAVALANAANPICLIIPCHRVINKNGKLGGYSGGINQKVALLTHEAH